MNKKLIYLTAVIFLFASFCSSASYAITTMPKNTDNITVEADTDEFKKDELSIIKRISLRDKFKRSPESQIESFFKKYTKYSEKNEIGKLKELYSDNYVNNDGFDKETLFKVMEEASEAYKNVNYETEILSIDVDGTYAVVNLHETAEGETAQKAAKINDYGSIFSDIYFVNYMRKEDGKWKIIASEIKSEKVALKYGEAKNTNVIMHAPKVIPAGSEYEVSVRVEAPDGALVVGSIVNEPIKFPQTQAKDVLRAVKYEELARVLKSNTGNNNEYAAVSLGITRPRIEPPSVVIDMTGMAIVMSRVNVFSVNNKIDEEIKNGSSTAQTKRK